MPFLLSFHLVVAEGYQHSNPSSNAIANASRSFLNPSIFGNRSGSGFQRSQSFSASTLAHENENEYLPRTGMGTGSSFFLSGRDAVAQAERQVALNEAELEARARSLKPKSALRAMADVGGFASGNGFDQERHDDDLEFSSGLIGEAFGSSPPPPTSAAERERERGQKRSGPNARDEQGQDDGEEDTATDVEDDRSGGGPRTRFADTHTNAMRPSKPLPARRKNGLLRPTKSLPASRSTFGQGGDGFEMDVDYDDEGEDKLKLNLKDWVGREDF